MRRSLLLLAMAPALAGCGSASAGSATTSSVPSTISVAQAGPPPASAAPATRSSTAPPPASTSAPAPSTASTSTAPAAVNTTPQNLPPSKKHKGPRKISVAEATRPIETSGGRSAAQVLVEEWKRRAVPRSDAYVVLVQRRLSSLAGKCTQPEAVIAGYVRFGIEKYRRVGVLESPVEMARALDSATPPGRSDCKAILRTLLAQVEQG